MSGRHVVFGSGPLGSAVARELVRRDHEVLVVSRRGTTSVSGASALAGDANDPGFAGAAASGATVVYQCAQPAYHRWVEEFPALQASILDGAAAAGARLIIGDNLYSYGDPHGAAITEDHPRHPTTRKGVVRKTMADAALDAHAAGRLEVAISRPSDYFGPGYDIMGDTVFVRALEGKSLRLIGSATMPHSFSYVPDAGRAMATLGTSDESWGEVWIPPVQPAVSQQEFADRVWAAAGHGGPARTQVIGRVGIAAIGLFSPALRETREMLYEFEKPFVVDSAKFESTFGTHPTPLDEAIATTLAHYRRSTH